MRKISNKEMVKIEKEAKKNKNLPTVTGKWLYCCGTIPTEVHLEATDGLKLYTSVKALKKHEKCWEECGIIKVKFTYYNVLKGKLKL